MVARENPAGRVSLRPAAESWSDAGVATYIELSRSALRWVTDAAVPAGGGVWWPEDVTPGAERADDIYRGTAGVLIALAEARLTGLTEFDEVARRAAGRLRWTIDHCLEWIAAQPPANQDTEVRWTGLYVGLAGHAVALQLWAQVSGDSQSLAAARAARQLLAEITREAPASTYYDLISGEAGILVTLADEGATAESDAVAAIADRLVEVAHWADGEPDWYMREGYSFVRPGFSHGAAGVAFALAKAGAALGRPDLIDVAVLAANRLVRQGTRPDGTLLVPVKGAATTPDDQEHFGWCHGPTGTLRLFCLLDQLRPGEGWAGQAQACRRAVLASGLPARRFPGFWDNLGQCCGTAGVGEMAIDAYQQSADQRWLSWADTLARDLADRQTSDAAGVRWSHAEHTADPPELPPAFGWMQGAAGITGFLLRLARAHADGPAASQLTWPDQVAFASAGQ